MNCSLLQLSLAALFICCKYSATVRVAQAGIPREKQGNRYSALLGKDTLLCKNLLHLQHLRGRICQVINLFTPLPKHFVTQVLSAL